MLFFFFFCQIKNKIMLPLGHCGYRPSYGLFFGVFFCFVFFKYNAFVVGKKYGSLLLGNYY